MDGEFKTLFAEAKWKLDWEAFEKVYDAIEKGDLRESEKIDMLRKACILLEGDPEKARAENKL